MSHSEPVVVSPEHSLGFAPSIVRNRYHVCAIGSVSRDVVQYQAEDIRSGRRVTLEVLRDEFADDREFVAAIRDQAGKLAKAIRVSPWLAGVYECDTTDTGEVFVALERIEGRPLRELLDDGTVIDTRAALRIANQVGEALTTLHHNGIVYGELTPDSVVIVKESDGTQSVKLVGIELTAAHRTPRGLPLRTCELSDLAPEQQYGQPTEASDVYALGKLLQRLATVRSTFHATDAVSVSAPVPLVIQTIIAKALHSHPHDRYPDISAMVSDISRAQRALLLHAGARRSTERASVSRRPFSAVSIRRALICAGIVTGVVTSLTVSARIVSHFRARVPAPALLSAPRGLSSTTTPRAEVSVDYRIPSLLPAGDSPGSTTTLKTPTMGLNASTGPAAVSHPSAAASAPRDHKDTGADVRPFTERTRKLDSSVRRIVRSARSAEQSTTRNHPVARDSNIEENAGDGSAAIEWLLNKRP